jgi:hypothetical protein
MAFAWTGVPEHLDFYAPTLTTSNTAKTISYQKLMAQSYTRSSYNDKSLRHITQVG